MAHFVFAFIFALSVYDVGPPPIVGVSGTINFAEANNEAHQHIAALRDFTKNQRNSQKWIQIVGNERYGVHKGYTFYENGGYITCLPGELSNVNVIKLRSKALVMEYNKVFDDKGKATSYAKDNCISYVEKRSNPVETAVCSAVKKTDDRKDFFQETDVWSCICPYLSLPELMKLFRTSQTAKGMVISVLRTEWSEAFDLSRYPDWVTRDALYVAGPYSLLQFFREICIDSPLKDSLLKHTFWPPYPVYQTVMVNAANGMPFDSDWERIRSPDLGEIDFLKNLHTVARSVPQVKMPETPDVETLLCTCSLDHKYWKNARRTEWLEQLVSLLPNLRQLRIKGEMCGFPLCGDPRIPDGIKKCLQERRSRDHEEVWKVKMQRVWETDSTVKLNIDPITGKITYTFSSIDFNLDLVGLLNY